MNRNAYQAYQQNSIQTATPGELTLMLYDGCIKFIKLAKRDIENNNIEGKNTNIQKAQNIIQELMLTLNQDMEISKQLMPLYDYLHHQLLQANINNDIEILDEVEGFVDEFRGTWREVIKLNRGQTKVSGQ